jgi:hypothetical protein
MPKFKCTWVFGTQVVEQRGLGTDERKDFHKQRQNLMKIALNNKNKSELGKSLFAKIYILMNAILQNFLQSISIAKTVNVWAGDHFHG